VNRKLIRPSLSNTKESYNSPGPSQPTRKKPAPPEQTHAENFYYVKQMQSRTPMTVVLTDGEMLNGTVEWYDRDCIKLTRYGSPNLMIYKHSIKYLFKTTEEAADGGPNGPLTGPNGSHHGR
jgi:host factor-I protein